MIPPSVPKQNTPVMDFDSPALMSKPWWMFLQGLRQGLTERIQSGTWANLPNPAQTQADSLYVVTDRGNAIYQFQGTSWVLLEGTVRLVQADIAAFKAGLGTGDAGLLLEVTDYRHVLRWSGTALGWGPGEDGRHDIVGLPVDPDDTTGWQLCDGTATTYLKKDGTTGSFTTPDLVSTPAKAAYLKLGSPVSGPNPAVAPTFSGGTISSAATGITATTGAPIGTTNVPVTSPTTPVASSAHTHTVTINDPTHTHTLTGGSIGADGEPQNYVLRPFFRR